MEIVGIIFGVMGIVCISIAIWLYIQMKNERIKYLELQTKEGKGPERCSYRRRNWTIDFSKRFKTPHRKHNCYSYRC